VGSHLYIILIQLVVFFYSLLHSQSVEPRFDTLPIGEPNCILNDSQGFIWIGAQVGLFRYDGYELKYYQPEPFDSTSLSANDVSVIKEDAKGNLWVGTFGGGLNYFDQRTEKFIRYMDDPLNPADIGSNSICQINVNSDGSLWLGTTDNGFTHLSWDENGNPVYKYFNHKSIPCVELTNNNVPAMYLDRENILWVGTFREGLIRFDPTLEEIKYFRNDPADPTSLSSNSVSAICEDDSGYLWIGTGHPLKDSGNGLNRFDRRTETFRHYKKDPADPSSLCSDIISSLEIDQQGILWIGTEDEGINSIALEDLYTGKKLEFIRYSSFQPKIINKIYRDQLDNIWIAPQDMQVYKYDRQQSPFIYYGPIRGKPDGMKDSGIECIYIDKKGNIWFGHHFSGLDKYDPATGRFTHYPHIPGSNRGPSSNWINGICEDLNGNFWIGTSQNGLDCYNPQTGIFSNIQSDPSSPHGLKSNNIRCLITRRNGDLWLASQYKGIQIFDTQKKSFRNVDFDSTGIQGIHTLYEDTYGKLWIGTMENGLYGLSFDQEQLTAVEHFFHDPHDRTSLGNNNISDIIRPQVYDTSALWIATDNGLNRLDLITKTFTHFYERDGLPGNYVLSVLEDNTGDIWVSTTRGVGRINLRTNTFRSYGVGDGLPFISFGGARQNTAKSADGQLFFSGADGSIGIYPDQIKDNPHIPPIRLTDFRIFHESFKLDTAIQFKKTITLHHDQNAFSFTFAALNFTNPEKNQYAYKMEGFHDDWIHIGNERTASFTNLDPGQYVFRVKGSNNHGRWNQEGASIKVIILPPWWRSKPAYALYLLLFGTVLFTGWKFQMNRLRLKHQLELEHLEATKLQEVDHLKSRFFANISHEFRTPLTLILGPIQKWLPRLRNHDLKQDLQLMQRNANRLYRLINQLLDLSRLESGSMILQAREENIVPLLRGYVQSFESQAKLKKISLTFSAEQESINLYVDREKIEKIIYNLLSNAFKFTPEGGHISVVIHNPPVSPLPSGGASRTGIYKGGNEKGSEEYIEISVSDTGKGIPADKIDRIFDRFYQVDDSSIRDHEGSGIGLALTRELVELHHGKITVKSVLGTGTTFTIWLPLGKEHLQDKEIVTTAIPETSQSAVESVSEQEISGSQQLRTRKKLPLILVVEDNSDVRFYIRGYLEPFFAILEAADGKEGLQTAIEEIPDLIISDVMMPEMDGFEFCKKIKTDQRTSHIPVILLTARAASQDKIDGLETGADDYVIKPFEAKELQVRVKNLIAQREKLRIHYLQSLKLEAGQLQVISADEAFLNKSILAADKNLSDPEYSMEQFAREVGFSLSQLARKLESITGLTPSLFLRSRRLLHARLMLDKKAGNIAQIAYQCGFNNLSYFSRSFKIQFGQLPSEYIKGMSR
jgi:signal transduction histidine kinase/ligand-binding sensor domain-containing protein/DNA-binding response OmpR family regulator